MGLCSNILPVILFLVTFTLVPSFIPQSIDLYKILCVIPCVKVYFNWLSASQRIDYISFSERSPALSHYSPTKQTDLLFPEFCRFGGLCTCVYLWSHHSTFPESCIPLNYIHTHSLCTIYNILLKHFLFYYVFPNHPKWSLPFL